MEHMPAHISTDVHIPITCCLSTALAVLYVSHLEMRFSECIPHTHEMYMYVHPNVQLTQYNGKIVNLC